MSTGIPTLTSFINNPLQALRNLGSQTGSGLPQTQTKTSFGLTIHAVVNGRRGVIGAVHEVGMSQSMEVDEEYEVNSLGGQKPRELVPQSLRGRKMTLKRYDLYSATLEQVFGQPELLTLTDQLYPVSLRLSWKNVQNSQIASLVNNIPLMSVYEFTNCVISDLSRTVSAEGDRIVGADATVVWSNIVKLQ